MRSLLSPVRGPRVLFMCSGGGGGGSDSGSDSGGDSGSSSGGGFLGTSYTSLTDMFDGGGAGGSGDTYFSGSHDDYVASGGTGAVAHTSNDNDNTSSAPAASTSDDSDSGGYTSIVDMFDGGGAGGSGSEFFSGSHEEYLETEAGITDTQTDAAGLTNYSGGDGTYTGIIDMIDGGGPNQSGDTYQGSMSDVGNAVTGGGITGAVLSGIGNALTGAETNVDAALSATEQILVDDYGWTDNGDGTLTNPYGGIYDYENASPEAVEAIGTAGPQNETEAESAQTSSGYTSITDMLDGGGPGQSGDTFGGALGGISNALGATPLDSGIEPTGPAGVVNDLIGSATNYDDFSDMIDGGGPGASGDA